MRGELSLLFPTGKAGRARLCWPGVKDKGQRVVISTIADGIFGVVDQVRDAGEGLISDRTIRLGVTGLARAGKTVFITSLVANLMDRGRMPGLVAVQEETP